MADNHIPAGCITTPLPTVERLLIRGPLALVREAKLWAGACGWRVVWPGGGDSETFVFQCEREMELCEKTTSSGEGV